jgi:rhomboid protease GluP
VDECVRGYIIRLPGTLLIVSISGMANCTQCGRKLPPLSFKKICQWCVQHEAAQRGDDSVQQQVMPAPWVRRSESSITLTQILFGANLAVFLAMVLASGDIASVANPEQGFQGQLLAHFGANFGPYTLSGQWWRLFTYMFLHVGLLHIAINMWCLWDLGALCESLYGRWTYAAIYILTGLGGGIASVGWNPSVLSVGASGAIFGLAGALIASFYLGEFSLPSIAIKGTLRSLLFFVGFNVFFGIAISGVDNACHAGGLITGLILGALVARFAPQPGPSRRASVLAIGALVVLLAGFGVDRWRGTQMRMYRALESSSESGSGDSIANLQVLVRRQPKMPQAHFLLARAYLDRQRLPEAEAEFKRVLELQPGNPAAEFDLGMVYFSEKRTDLAKATFTQMLSKDANDADAHVGLGLVLADQGNHQAAVEEFKTALRLGPQVSGVYYELGRSYAQLKMYDDAIAAYINQRNRDGDDADLEAALAEAYQSKGMTQQAQQAASKAAELKNSQRN